MTLILLSPGVLWYRADRYVRHPSVRFGRKGITRRKALAMFKDTIWVRANMHRVRRVLRDVGGFFAPDMRAQFTVELLTRARDKFRALVLARTAQRIVINYALSAIKKPAPRNTGARGKRP